MRHEYKCAVNARTFAFTAQWLEKEMRKEKKESAFKVNQVCFSFLLFSAYQCAVNANTLAFTAHGLEKDKRKEKESAFKINQV